MARLHQRVAAVALLVLFAVAGAFAQGEVVTLTDDTFEHQTQASSGQTTGAWFVKFYAPWCGHCRAMAGTWAELAAEVEGTGVIVADVDATANPITTDRFKGLVKGFPTLLLFRDRGVFKYTGARDLESLILAMESPYIFLVSRLTDREPLLLRRVFTRQAHIPVSLDI